ncbi:MAG: PAS domain S-box protein [Bacteroidales bacterium]|nr:PAS domain S-box protein [Bacteroidales bacterium]
MENYKNKSKDELIQEIENLKRNVKDLEKNKLEFKKVEEALKESNENFRQVVSNITTVIWKADIGKNGAFENTYSSPVIDELLELPAGTIKNDWDKYFNYIKPEYLEQVNKAFKEAIISPGKVINCEYEVLKDTGKTAWFHSKGRCFEKNGKLHVFGSTTDITERKQAEKVLRESEEKFYSVSSTAQDAVIMMDNEGNIFYWNKASEKIFGYTKEEANGKELHKLIVPEKYLEDFQKGFKKFRKTGEGAAIRKTIELLAIRKDGTEFPVELSLSAIKLKGKWCASAIVRDITERKKAEEALRESEARFRKLLENITTVAVQGYNADGIIHYWNKANELIYGYTAEEAIGKNLVDMIIPSEMKEDVQKLIKHGAKTGEMPPAAELTLMRKDGNPVTVFSSHAVVQQSGKGPLLFCMDMDLTERKKAEKELRESEEKYRLLADNSTDAIWQTNLKLVFTYVSPSIKKIFGYSVEEWVGTGLSQHASRKEFLKMARKASYAIKNYKKIKYLTFEVVMLKKDGTEIPVEITAKLLLNKKGLPVGLQGTTRDITKRLSAEQAGKQAEETLIEKEKELRLITDSTLDTVFMLNKTGIIVYLNQPAEKLFNRKLEDMPGTSFTKYVPKKELPRYFKRLKEVFRHKKITNFETYVINRDGQQIPVEINGQIIKRDGKYFGLGTIRDITERLSAEQAGKQAEEALRESEKQMHTLINAMPDFVCLKDGDGRWLKTNDAGIRIFQLEGTDYRGKNDSELAELNSKLRGAFLTCKESDARVRKEGGIIHGEETITDTAGKVRVFDVTKVSVSQTDSKRKGLVVLGHDITERKLAEDELKKYREHLEELIKERTLEVEEKAKKIKESQKAMRYLLEDVNEAREELVKSNKKIKETNKDLESFAYSVSHDLKSPLRAINGYTKVLLEDYPGLFTGEKKEFMDLIVKNSVKMNTLIDDLLRFSRAGRNKLDISEFNMSVMVKDVINAVKENYKSQNIESKIQEDVIINADISAIKHVLLNLIGNAVKFSENETVSKIEFGIKNIDGINVYYIKDNGIGFSMKYTNKVFDVFQRLHGSEKYEGTGVGLALVKRIINKHGGKIRAESEIGKGSVFYFTI